MSDDIKDDEKEIDGDIEGAEGEIESGSAEPDFAPTAAAPVFDEEDEAVADPHSSFDEHAVVEDPHQEDIYGDAGAPRGFNEDDDEDDTDEDYGDSDSY